MAMYTKWKAKELMLFLKESSGKIIHYHTVEEEHAIQSDMFVYARFHSRNICSK